MTTPPYELLEGNSAVECVRQLSGQAGFEAEDLSKLAEQVDSFAPGDPVVMTRGEELVNAGVVYPRSHGRKPFFLKYQIVQEFGEQR